MVFTGRPTTLACDNIIWIRTKTVSLYFIFSEGTGRIRIMSVKVSLAIMCAGKLVDKLRCEYITLILFYIKTFWARGLHPSHLGAWWKSEKKPRKTEAQQKKIRTGETQIKIPIIMVPKKKYCSSYRKIGKNWFEFQSENVKKIDWFGKKNPNWRVLKAKFQSKGFRKKILSATISTLQMINGRPLTYICAPSSPVSTANKCSRSFYTKE